MAYRFIVVGAGSAGCVLANRLSANPQNTVLLIEAGGRDWHPFIHMPAGISRLVNNKRINWHYSTEPQCELHQRRLYWPRGRVWGGSSSINAMCYVRGQPQDYDEWASAGNPGWSFQDVLPYFRKSEHQQHGASAWHGVGGELYVSDLRDPNPLSRVFVEAGEALGLPLNRDFNGERQEGVGPYQATQRDGRRCSAAVAFLHPAQSRANLTIASHALATRVLIEQGRVVGVEYRQGGRTHVARCEGEVVLCAGSIVSPQLLMLSGIGPGGHLREHGINVLADLPGVGANLQDHLDVCTLHRCTQPVTWDFSLLDEARAFWRYLRAHRGPATSNIAEAGAFIRSSHAPPGRPDLQLHFVPAQLDDHGRNRLPGHGYTLHACFLRPRSRGHLSLRSSDAADAPEIHANYLHEPIDLTVLLEGVRISREILNTQPFDRWRGGEIFPGPGHETDAQLTEFIRRKAETIYHPVGTCRMGCDKDAVVDADLRVHGIERLRVADASIMPALVSGNTNAPVIMIAEKAADLIVTGNT